MAFFFALFEISDEISSCVDLNFKSLKSVFDLLFIIEKVFLNFLKNIYKKINNFISLK
jgi:hypothetical protein